MSFHSIPLSRFLRDDRGTVAVNRLFMVGAALATGLTAIGVGAFGDDTPPVEVPGLQARAEATFRAENGGRDRGDILADTTGAYFSGSEMRTRYAVYSSPLQTSDDEVRSAHRRWVRRAADRAYSQPGRATDMVMILEHALAARGLQPHRDF